MNLLERDTLNKIEKAGIDSEDNISKSYLEYCLQNYPFPEYQKFVLIKLQESIIHFEFCSEWLNIAKTEESSFIRKVALKNTLHIIYEYKRSLNSKIKTIRELADSRNLKQEKDELGKILTYYKNVINYAEKYRDLRNFATGHYDPNILKQITVIESIEEKKAIQFILGFIAFRRDIWYVYRDIAKKLSIV